MTHRSPRPASHLALPALLILATAPVLAQNFTDRLGGSGNQVKARFVTRHYVGEYIRYHFETASGSELVVKNLNDSSAPHLSAHDEVALAWLPEDSQALDRSDVPKTL